MEADEIGSIKKEEEEWEDFLKWTEETHFNVVKKEEEIKPDIRSDTPDDHEKGQSSQGKTTHADEDEYNNTPDQLREHNVMEVGSVISTENDANDENQNQLSPQDLSILLGDLCQFACLWCHFECNSYHQFCKHVSQNHSAKISPGKLAGDAEAHAKHLVLTRCKICHYVLPHDSSCIFMHLKRRHKKSNTTYTDQIFFNYAALYGSKKLKSDCLDFQHMQKCFVTIRISKLVQYIKDNINKGRVEYMEKGALAQYSLESIPSLGKILPLKPSYEIGNLCIFQCNVCNKELDCYENLILHLRHSCVRPRHFKTFHDRQSTCLKVARLHICRLCDETMLCDTKYIKSHLYSHHKLNLDKYMLKKPIHLHTSQLVPITKYRFKGLILSNLEKNQVPTESITKETENLCKFQCDQCMKRVNSMVKLKNHLLKCKGTSMFMQSYVVEAVFHQCMVCGKLILCDKEPLFRHLYHVHALRLEDYTRKRQNREMNSNPGALEKHSLNVKMPPAVKPFDQTTVSKESLPDHLTTIQVGNFCLFKCSTCDFKSDSLGGMTNHNKHSNHGPGNAKYFKENVIEARYHKCVFCKIIILCDNRIIDSHVKALHGYKLDKYKELCNEKYSKMKNCTKGKTCAKNSTLLNNSKERKFKLHGFRLANDIGQDSRLTITKDFLDLSTFRCDKCNREFGSWLHTRLHLSKCKKTTVFDSKYVIKAVFHECKICGVKILCDKHPIRLHLVGKHNLSGSSYSKFNNQSQLIKSGVKTVILEGKETPEKIVTFSRSLSKYFNSFVIPRDEINTNEMTSLVGNFCVFKCPRCQFQTKKWVKMNVHIKNSEHSSNTLMCFHQEYVHEAVYHKCYICAKGVLCDEEFIRRHVRTDHKINLIEKYRLQKNMEEEGSEIHDQTESFQKRFANLPSYIGEQMISKNPVNSCTFLCDNCLKTKRAWLTFRKHKHIEHGEKKVHLSTEIC